MSRGSPGSPLGVAHRAGNSLDRLRDAARVGADVIELDVQAHRGRLEIRHARRLWPLPLVMDGWRILPGWRTQLLLEDVLAEPLPAGVRLMLDLKGDDASIGSSVVAALARTGHALAPREVLVCGRYWPALEPFADVAGATVLLSARTPAEVAALTRRALRRDADGVSLHRSLLTTELVTSLREQLGLVLTWPINDVQALDEVVDKGVTGVITDSADVLRATLAC